MSLRNEKRKGKTVTKNGFNLDDLGNEKSKSMMLKIIESNKGVVFSILFLFVLFVTDIVLTFLMAFKLI